MPEFRRLTYKTPDGAWGIKGVSLLTCPARLYGAAAKLCDMESLCEDVYRAKDAELTLDALQELVDKGLGGRFIDLRRAPEGVEQGTVPGLYKQFNVIYILADEEDLFDLRTTYRKEDMYLYRINIGRENLKKAFLGFAEKINSLHERPRYYNTVTANCTTELVDTFKNYLGVRRWQWTPLFNGMCDQDAYDRGELLHLPGENFRELKKRSFLGHGGEGLDWAALRRRWEEGWRTDPSAPVKE